MRALAETSSQIHPSSNIPARLPPPRSKGLRQQLGRLHLSVSSLPTYLDRGALLPSSRRATSSVHTASPNFTTRTIESCSHNPHYLPTQNEGASRVPKVSSRFSRRKEKLQVRGAVIGRPVKVRNDRHGQSKRSALGGEKRYLPV